LTSRSTNASALRSWSTSNDFLIFQTIKCELGPIFVPPVIMYLFVIAMGTDHNVHMVARLRERRGRAEPARRRRDGDPHAGPTIAAVGLMLAGRFASLLLAGNSLLTQMGLAISSGIAIVSFVTALLLTPGSLSSGLRPGGPGMAT
jgi:RND superfamily putative drug exporter